MSHENTNIEFLRKKWTHFASVLDYSKTGAVSLKDHEDMAERAISAGGIEPGSLRATQVRNKLIKTFERLYAPLNGGEPVPYSMVVQNYEANPEETRRIVNQNLYAFFDMIDLNGDGVIQLSEFRRFYHIFGLSEAEADQVFKMIDLNGNGILERHELVTFAVDFFFSTDETSVSKNFFGIHFK